MLVVSTRSELRQWQMSPQNKGLSLGLVPTMGALHAGHITLIDKALKENDRVCCSIFVNPTQFNNPGDLKNYPRTLENDLELLKAAGCSMVFTPEVKEMYPEGEDQSRYEVDFGDLATVMEGEFRPGHFRGVGLIVGKLFDFVAPDRAYFGEKDYQQLLVVRRLAELMKLDLEVVGCAIAREPNGLAMSSRNKRLDATTLDKASLIHQSLLGAKEMLPHSSVSATEQWVTEQFAQQDDFDLEYFIISNSNTLQAPDSDNPKSGLIGCISAFAGPVRLIDNMILIP